MPHSPWEPLPPDVAEWMGLDEAMVPFARDLAGPDEPSPVQQQAWLTTS